MKNLRSNRTASNKNYMRIISGLVAVLLVGVIVNGCGDSLTGSKRNHSKYLNIDFSKDKTSQADLKKYKQAKKRLDKYVVIKNGLYHMEISSGKVVNISQKLFKHFYQRMEKANNKIIKGKYVIYSRKLVKLSTSNQNVKRLKTSGVEGDELFSYTIGTDTFYGTRTIYWDLSYSDYLSDSAASYLFDGGAIAAGYLGSGPAAAMLESFGLIYDQQCEEEDGVTVEFFNILNPAIPSGVRCGH